MELSIKRADSLTVPNQPRVELPASFPSSKEENTIFFTTDSLIHRLHFCLIAVNHLIVGFIRLFTSFTLPCKMLTTTDLPLLNQPDPEHVSVYMILPNGTLTKKFSLSLKINKLAQYNNQNKTTLLSPNWEKSILTRGAFDSLQVFLDLHNSDPDHAQVLSHLPHWNLDPDHLGCKIIHGFCIIPWSTQTIT